QRFSTPAVGSQGWLAFTARAYRDLDHEGTGTNWPAPCHADLRDRCPGRGAGPDQDLRHRRAVIPANPSLTGPSSPLILRLPRALLVVEFEEPRMPEPGMEPCAGLTIPLALAVADINWF